MTDKVSVDVSATPDKVLAAFKRIQEAAKAAGRDIKSMADISFPGLEDAEKTLREFQRGFDQMMSSAVAGRTAQSLRSGVTAGMYGRDPVSWLLNSGRQFPDQKAHEHHMNSVLQQASRLSNFQPAVPAEGGSGGGGVAAMLPMMKGLLPLLGIGTGLGYLVKKAGDAGAEETQISDLRRSVSSLDEPFSRFRDNILKSTEGLGLTYTETARLAQEYSRLSGALNSAQAAAGTHEGAALARMFGMDPSHGVGLLGRAGILNVGGSSASEQAKLLSEAMVRSGLGGKQEEAANALMRFAERNASMTGDAGNVRGFMDFFTMLTNSGSVGMRANADSILSGYDSAMRRGGNAGDAGKAFLYNILSDMDIKSPFKAQMIMEKGFFADIGGGKQFGPEALRRIIAMSNGDMDLAAGRASGLFGGSMSNASLVLDAYQKSGGNTKSKEFMEAWAKIDAEMKNSDPGAQARDAQAKLSNSLDALGQKLVEPLTAIKESVAKVAIFTDKVANKLGFGDEQPTAVGAALGSGSPVGAISSLMRSGVRAAVGAFGSGDSDPNWTAMRQAYEKDLGIPGLLWGQFGAESSFGKAKNIGKNGIFQLTDVSRKDIKERFGEDIDPLDKMSALRGAYLFDKLQKERILAAGKEYNMNTAAIAYNSGMGGVTAGRINDPDYADKVAQHAKTAPAPVKVEVVVSGTVEGELLDPNRTAVGKIRLKPRISPPTMAPAPQ